MSPTANISQHLSLLFRATCLIASCAAFSATGAQDAAAGAIEGRVINAITGNYLNNARVTVAGTTIETFTDSFGQYRLRDVPTGDVSIQVCYTGLAPQTANI